MLVMILSCIYITFLIHSWSGILRLLLCLHIIITFITFSLIFNHLHNLKGAVVFFLLKEWNVKFYLFICKLVWSEIVVKWMGWEMRWSYHSNIYERNHSDSDVDKKLRSVF